MTTYVMTGKIVFPKFNGRNAIEIRKFSSVRIDESWKSLTDTATIEMPRKVRSFNRDRITEVFRNGDPVEIWLGYNGDYKLEFSGYISKAPAGIPLKIELEDEMYQLKRKMISLSLDDCSLKTLLGNIAPGYDIVCDETKLMGSVRFSNITAAQCLEELKQKGINCFFVGKTLHAMDPYSREESNVVSVLLEKTAGESLEQKAIENTKVIIELIQKRGKPIKVEYGDSVAGNVIKRKYSKDSNITESAMLEEAKMIFKKAKLPGMDGDVVLFGLPVVHHGDVMSIDSDLYDERKGKYYIDSVTKTFDKNGYRQKSKLGVEA